MPVPAHAASIRQTTSPRQASDTRTGRPQPGHMAETTAQVHRLRADCGQLIAARSGLDALCKAQVTSAPRRNLSDKSSRWAAAWRAGGTAAKEARHEHGGKIGRASCRERVEISVVA